MKTPTYSSGRAAGSAQEMDRQGLKTHPLHAIALSCSGIALLVLEFVLPTLLFNSCYTARVYAPQPQNNPGLERQHDIRAGLGLAWSADNRDATYSGRLTGIHAYAAYAPLNHWGIIMNYSHLKNRSRDVSRSFESGIGFFLPINPHVILENYIGIGMGHMSVDQYHNSVHLNGEIHRRHLFLQPSFTIKSSHVEVAFAMKTSRIDFFDLQLNTEPNEPDKLLKDGGEDTQKQINTVHEIEQKGGFTTLEPSITLRGGSKNIKAQLQLGISAAFDPILATHTYPKFGSFGVQIAIPGRKKSRQCPSFNQCK